MTCDITILANEISNAQATLANVVCPGCRTTGSIIIRYEPGCTWAACEWCERVAAAAPDWNPGEVADIARSHDPHGADFRPARR